MSVYLLDSDVFIQAKNLHYGFDFCPAFWDWLDVASSDAKVFSIEKVRLELEEGADALASWASSRPSFFLPPDPAMLPALGRVSDWATSGRYEPAASSTFLQLADYYLVAHALAHGYIVVTQEVSSASVRRIKIPDACVALGVTFMNTFEMLRVERARFIL